VAIYKALKEQRHKARVMADRAADAAQQLAEAQRRLDIVNSAAAAAPAANGASRATVLRRGLRQPSTLRGACCALRTVPTRPLAPARGYGSSATGVHISSVAARYECVFSVEPESRTVPRRFSVARRSGDAAGRRRAGGGAAHGGAARRARGHELLVGPGHGRCGPAVERRHLGITAGVRLCLGAATEGAAEVSDPATGPSMEAAIHGRAKALGRSVCVCVGSAQANMGFGGQSVAQVGRQNSGPAASPQLPPGAGQRQARLTSDCLERRPRTLHLRRWVHIL